MINRCKKFTERNGSTKPFFRTQELTLTFRLIKKLPLNVSDSFKNNLNKRGGLLQEKSDTVWVTSLIFTLIFTSFVIFEPKEAHAGVRSFVKGLFSASAEETPSSSEKDNSQNMSILESVPNPLLGEVHDVVIVDDSAIETTVGPEGTAHEIEEKVAIDKVSLYTVRKGDTLSQIAEMFGVNNSTIMWANDIKSPKDLKVGMELVVLPISGVKYIVAKGDTLQGIAKKFNGDVNEIVSYNSLGDNPKLSVGTEIIIPNGEIAPEKKPTSSVASGGSFSNNSKYKNFAQYFIKPASGTKTQGLHGKFKSSVDIANKSGTPVVAAASGKVMISRTGGWNGGYGNYVVIEHPNGLQTLYGHLLETSVSAGTTVSQGDIIGKMGSSGRSTGTHLHFEILGGVRNWNPF